MAISSEQERLLNEYKKMRTAQQIRNLDRMLHELGVRDNRDESNYEKFLALFRNSSIGTKIRSIDWFISNFNIFVARQRNVREQKDLFMKEIEEFIHSLSIPEQESLVDNTHYRLGDIIGFTTVSVQDRSFERMRKSSEIYYVGKLDTVIKHRYKSEILASIKDQTIKCENLIYQLWDVMNSQERMDYYGYLIQNSQTYEIKETWKDLNSETQKKYFPMILRRGAIYANTDDLLDIWASTNPETQKEHLLEFIENTRKYYIETQR